MIVYAITAATILSIKITAAAAACALTRGLHFPYNAFIMRPRWEKIKNILTRIGDFNLRIILAIAYVLVFLPYAAVAYVIRISSAPRKKPSQWQTPDAHPCSLEALRRQF